MPVLALTTFLRHRKIDIAAWNSASTVLLMLINTESKYIPRPPWTFGESEQIHATGLTTIHGSFAVPPSLRVYFLPSYLTTLPYARAVHPHASSSQVLAHSELTQLPTLLLNPHGLSFVSKYSAYPGSLKARKGKNMPRWNRIALR